MGHFYLRTCWNAVWHAIVGCSFTSAHCCYCFCSIKIRKNMIKISTAPHVIRVLIKLLQIESHFTLKHVHWMKKKIWKFCISEWWRGKGALDNRRNNVRWCCRSESKPQKKCRIFSRTCKCWLWLTIIAHQSLCAIGMKTISSCCFYSLNRCQSLLISFWDGKIHQFAAHRNQYFVKIIGIAKSNHVILVCTHRIVYLLYIFVRWAENEIKLPWTWP